MPDGRRVSINAYTLTYSHILFIVQFVYNYSQMQKQDKIFYPYIFHADHINCISNVTTKDTNAIGRSWQEDIPSSLKHQQLFCGKKKTFFNNGKNEWLNKSEWNLSKLCRTYLSLCTKKFISLKPHSSPWVIHSYHYFLKKSHFLWHYPVQSTMYRS